MSMNIVVPELGPSIEEAVFVKWLVKEGDYVRKGTPLFSVETDKTVVDCESLGDGYLRGIAVEEGATVQVDQVLGVLSESAPSAPASARAAGDAAISLSRPPPERAEELAPQAAPPTLPERTSEPAARSASGSPAMVRDPDGRARISPRARRMSRELGVGLEGLEGSGPMGRVVRRDVERLIARAVAGGAPGGHTGIETPAASGRTRDVPLSSMRRTIARRLTESSQATPVFHATAKIWCDPLLTLKEQLRQGAGIAVTINDIVVKGCALALRRCPEVNATFHGELVRLHEDVDVAVAVAVEGGLITPIVRNADAKRLVQLSAELGELCGRARAGTLSRSDYEGGTFTVSNLGMHGLEQFTAIINPPQCAILAVGAVEHELHLDAGIARERRVLRATLSSDHRVIDGALAARFLGELRSVLENPACLLV